MSKREIEYRAAIGYEKYTYGCAGKQDVENPCEADVVVKLYAVKQRDRDVEAYACKSAEHFESVCEFLKTF